MGGSENGHITAFFGLLLVCLEVAAGGQFWSLALCLPILSLYALVFSKGYHSSTGLKRLCERWHEFLTLLLVVIVIARIFFLFQPFV